MDSEPAKICTKCPSAKTSRHGEVKDFEMEVWHDTAAKGCPSCRLFCDVAMKIAPSELHKMVVSAACDVLEPWRSYLCLEVYTMNQVRKSTCLYTDDERINSEFPCIEKVNYADDPKFFKKTGVEAARMWLDHCLHSHSTCGQCDEGSPLPTRLIAVGSTALDPHLHIPRPGESGAYATLSYCWGKGKQFVTTKDNLGDRQIGFALDLLPKTCQDAIHATRSLGIPYIWIDQICIIQDDPEDWAKESAKMNLIYTNSLLTLAALTSPGGDTGLRTYDWSTEYDVVTAEIQLHNGEKGSVYGKKKKYSYNATKLGFLHQTTSTHVNPPDPPEYLQSRLWTLQEVVLSPRILWFGHGDIGWSCKEVTACECEPFPVPTSHHELPPHLAADLSPTSPLPKHDWLPIWYNYIEEATQRLVSVQTDRLPAVSGLAGAMKHHIGGRYIAGHWEVDIEKSLLWSILEPQDFRYYGAALLPPMVQDYAPTWSWASVCRPMSHITALLPKILELNMNCKVLNIDFRPSTVNLNGPGVGVLTMEAVLLAVDVLKTPRFGFKHRTGVKYLTLRAEDLEWHPDPRGSTKTLQDLDLYFAIHMRWPEDAEPDEWGSLWALVLEKVDEAGCAEWEARYEACVADRSDAPLGGGELAGSPVKRLASMAGSVFRRIGCLMCSFRLGEVSWEELVEEYKQRIYII